MKSMTAHTEISDSDAKSKKKVVGAKLEDVEALSEKDDNEILSKLKENVDGWYTYWDEFITCARNHITFLYVDQWDSEIRESREALRVPTMEFNHVRPMIDGIVGQQRKNSPQMVLKSISGDAKNQNDVEFMNDLLREIAYRSHADEAYQTCFKNMLVTGWGFLRAAVHYENADTFDMIVKISSNPDYQIAFWDPNATDKHRSNGDFCGVYQRIGRDDFERDYPGIQNPVSTGQTSDLFWSDADTITVCDIYYKDYFKKTIVKLNDGSVMTEKEAKEILAEQSESASEITEDIAEITGAESESNFAAPMLDALEEALNIIEIVEKRDVLDYKIKHVRFIENNIIDKTDWPGSMLPIVYVPNNSTCIDGRENPISFINDLQDAQKLHNYVVSDMARGLLQTVKSKFIGTEQMTKGYEGIWGNQAAVQGVLYCNPDPRFPGAIPQQIDPPPFNPALMQMQELTSSEMGVISGRYEESRGQESNAMSGVAIKERIAAANNIVNISTDNLMSGIEQLGKVIMDLVPEVYGDEREVSVRDESGEVKKITINKKTTNFNMNDSGDIDADIDSMDEMIENDVRNKEYDLVVKAAGSLDYQKKQSLEFWLGLITALPQSGPLLGDLIAGESEADGAAIAAERLKMLLPPEILAKEEGKPMPPPQPNPMAEMEKMRMQLYQKELELKQEKMENERQKDEIDAAVSMKNLEMKDEELEFKQEKAAEDAKIARIRAQAELKKANAAMRNY